MNHTKIFKILTVLFAVVLCLGPVGLAGPVGTAFTYQGRLIDANEAADGVYDFQFKLFDANSDGNKLGSDVNKPEVDVIDGYFTVALDFGTDPNSFNGDARWLEIGVRPGDQNDPNVYTALSPRQKVTPTPYALYAKTASGGVLPWQVNGTDIYYNNGNVGIGTATPYSKLSVGGNGYSFSSIYGYSGSDVGVLGHSTSGEGVYGAGGNTGVHGYSIGGEGVYGEGDTGVYGQGGTCGVYGSGDTYDFYGNGPKSYFAGNVGVGTMSPATKLQVAGVITDAAGNSNNWNTAYSWGNHALAGYLTAETDPKVGTLTVGYMPKWNGTQLANGTIYDNGNVGIGTTTPDEKFTVGEGTIKATTSAYTGRAVYGWASNSGDSSYNYGGYFMADGSDGIGIIGYANNTGYYINYGGFFVSYGTYGQGVHGYAGGSSGTGVYGYGNQYDFFAAGPGTDYGSSSSIRWKRDIRPIDNPLDKVMNLRGVYFNWDAEHGGQHDVGMVAEEVGKVLPEIVVYEKNGVDAVGMDYSKTTPLLVEAIKALKKENDELKRRLEVLEAAVGKSDEGGKQ